MSQSRQFELSAGDLASQVNRDARLRRREMGLNGSRVNGLRGLRVIQGSWYTTTTVGRFFYHEDAVEGCVLARLLNRQNLSYELVGNLYTLVLQAKEDWTIFDLTNLWTEANQDIAAFLKLIVRSGVTLPAEFQGFFPDKPSGS